MSSTNEETCIAGLSVEDLGVLPSVVGQVNQLADDPTTTSDQVAALIVRDPTLTSKILRMLNSSFYGLRQPVTSIEHAVTYLGINQIRNIVTSSALIESFRFEHGLVEPRTLWEHSLGCAIAAKRIGGLLSGPRGDEAYLGGLLHDLGRIAFVSNFAEEYAGVIDLGERGLCLLNEAEESHFGLSHSEVGYRLGSAWGFPDEVLKVIRHHHRPEEAGESAERVALITVANGLCHSKRLGFGYELDIAEALNAMERGWELLADSHSRLDRAQAEEAALEALDDTKALMNDLF